MASKLHYFSGPARWAKVHNPDKKYGHYSIEVRLDEPSLQTFKDSGLQGKPSKDGEGYYSFRRKPDALVWQDKKQVRAGAPVVCDAHGNSLSDLVGNGSDVTVKVMTYDFDNSFGKGKGHRLESVRVDKLVKYEAPSEGAVMEDSSVTKLKIMF